MNTFGEKVDIIESEVLAKIQEGKLLAELGLKTDQKKQKKEKYLDILNLTPS